MTDEAEAHNQDKQLILPFAYSEDLAARQLAKLHLYLTKDPDATFKGAAELCADLLSTLLKLAGGPTR